MIKNLVTGVLRKSSQETVFLIYDSLCTSVLPNIRLLLSECTIINIKILTTFFSSKKLYSNITKIWYLSSFWQFLDRLAYFLWFPLFSCMYIIYLFVLGERFFYCKVSEYVISESFSKHRDSTLFLPTPQLSRSSRKFSRQE